LLYLNLEFGGINLPSSLTWSRPKWMRSLKAVPVSEHVSGHVIELAAATLSLVT
jgi:hypothetical protein